MYRFNFFSIFRTCSKCWLISLASSSYALGRCSLFWSESFTESLSLHLMLLGVVHSSGLNHSRNLSLHLNIEQFWACLTFSFPFIFILLVLFVDFVIACNV
jgi:hypothetical protein